MNRKIVLQATLAAVMLCAALLGGQQSRSASAGTGLGSSIPRVITLPTPDYSVTREDQELARLYTEASILARRRPEEGEGCLTMPYLDLQRICKPLMLKKSEACHPPGGNRICGGELGHELTEAINRGDRARIIQIRAECQRRQAGLEKCSTARKNGTPIWDRALETVEADIRVFSKKQAAARSARDDKAADFWRRLQQNADHILNYYRPGIENHKIEMGTTFDHVRECERNIERANRAL